MSGTERMSLNDSKLISSYCNEISDFEPKGFDVTGVAKSKLQKLFENGSELTNLDNYENISESDLRMFFGLANDHSKSNRIVDLCIQVDAINGYCISKKAKYELVGYFKQLIKKVRVDGYVDYNHDVIIDILNSNNYDDINQSEIMFIIENTFLVGEEFKQTKTHTNQHYHDKIIRSILIMCKLIANMKSDGLSLYDAQELVSDKVKFIVYDEDYTNKINVLYKLLFSLFRLEKAIGNQIKFEKLDKLGYIMK